MLNAVEGAALNLRQAAGRTCTITELGCGNGMLLFRLAPLLGSTGGAVSNGLCESYLFGIRQARGNCKSYSLFFQGFLCFLAFNSSTYITSLFIHIDM